MRTFLCAAALTLAVPADAQVFATQLREVDLLLKQCDTAAAAAKLEQIPRPASGRERAELGLRAADLLLEDPAERRNALDELIALQKEPELTVEMSDLLDFRIQMLRFVLRRHAEIRDGFNGPAVVTAALWLERGRTEDALALIDEWLCRNAPSGTPEGIYDALWELRRAAGRADAPKGTYVDIVNSRVPLLPSIRVAAAPLVEARAQPEYPRQALRDRVEGWILMEMTVDASGAVTSARPVAAQPRGVFESAAIRAALQWKFVPGTFACKPGVARVLQRLDFHVKE